MTGTLKAGICLLLALHVALGVGIKYFWHRLGLPISPVEHTVTITMASGDDVQSAVTPPPAAASVPTPEPAPAAPQIATTVPPTEPFQAAPPAPAAKPEPPPPTPVSAVAIPVQEAITEMAPPSRATFAGSERRKEVVLFAPTRPAMPVTDAAPAAKAGDDIHKPDSAPAVRATPIYRINPEPAYPPSARRRGQQGLVLLTVHVTAQGWAASVEVKRSCGFAVLDEAALRAVRNWEFEPARIDSLAVDSEIEVPLRFKLTD